MFVSCTSGQCLGNDVLARTVPLVISVVVLAAWPTMGNADRQCFYPEADTFVSDEEPSTNFGEEPELRVSFLGDASVEHRETLIRFNVDTIPEDATINWAYLRLKRKGGGGTSNTVDVRSVEDPWSETSLTWDNRPSYGVRIYDSVIVESSKDVHEWALHELVNDWKSGYIGNNGLVLVTGQSTTEEYTFDSSESNHQYPRLCVDWETDLEGVDIEVTDIEVTQSIQDLNNSIRLVEGKSTYVRVHTRLRPGSDGSVHRTFATLSLGNDEIGSGPVLHPINERAGHAWISADPERLRMIRSFLFEVPTRFAQSETTFVAHVNPVFGDWRPRPYPEESDYSNNSMATWLDFEQVPKVSMNIFLIDYVVPDGNGGEKVISTSIAEAEQMIDWIERVYPIDGLNFSIRRLDAGKAEFDEDGKMTKPRGSFLLNLMRRQRILDKNASGASGTFVEDARYYALISDEGMSDIGGGKASLGGLVGAGFTGQPRDDWGWDNDGSYGDWIGGHELGHNLARRHTDGGCGSKGTSPYPHENGVISPDMEGEHAIYGFDAGTPSGYYRTGHHQEIALYPPDSTDMMAYCADKWIGDFTYHKILDYIQANIDPGRAMENRAIQVEPEDRLLVLGTIDPDEQLAKIDPVFTIPDALPIKERIPGEYSIVLTDETDNTLARYRFTPEQEVAHGIPGDLSEEVQQLGISELVPYVDGTAAVSIEGPAGILAQVSPGSGVPNVAITSPQPGDSMTGMPYRLSWSASDPDGDALTFHVQYSHDDGNSWETVAQNIADNSVDIPPDNLLTSDSARFRVWATDGINTAIDTMDGSFSLTSMSPEVDILTPLPETYVGSNQTLKLKARVRIPGYGNVPDDDITWFVGEEFWREEIGKGRKVAVTGLEPGKRLIEVHVRTPNEWVIETVEDIYIVENPTLLPLPDNELSIAPGNLVFRPAIGKEQARIMVGNRAGANSIEWGAFLIDPWGTSWIQLHETTGQTPAELNVTVDADGLDPGVYHDTILLSSPDTDHGVKRVPVTLWNYSASDFELEIFQDRFEHN